MQAVIMAGGKGSRVTELFPDIPKPMFPVQGKPLLETHITHLREQGIKDIIIITGYLGERIREHFGDGHKFGAAITYFDEKVPLGTAGALPLIEPLLEDTFLLIFGDLYADICYERFIAYHREKQAVVTLFAHPNSHPYDSDLIICDEENRVICWDSKLNKREYDYKNLVNAGLYVLSKACLKSILQNGKCDLEKDVIKPLIDKGAEVFAYRSTEYVKDMGTPDRYLSVNRDLERGIPAARNLLRPQKCIFLDRDGTINEYVGFLTRIEEMTLIPGTVEAIRTINCSEYLCVVVTNQPVVARGECTFEDLENIHKRLETLLGQGHAYLDGLMVCPHHPDRGFMGERKELKVSCECRKPGILLFLNAAEQLNIDLSQSYMIGDSTADIAAGINAGMRTILLETGQGGKDNKYPAVPDSVCENLQEAVKLILS